MILSTSVLIASLAFGAITPAKTSNVSTNSTALPEAKAPKLIYVAAFTLATPPADADNSSTESSGGRPHLFGRLRGGEDNTIIGRHREEQKEDALAKVPGVLQKALIDNLNKSIAPATRDTEDRPADARRWVITGQFTEVDTGSGALQAGVGLGAGKSTVGVRAQVYATDNMDTPFLVFDSTGASGHMPGVVVTKNPYVAIAKFVMSKKEPEKEAKKIAKSIAEEIGKFMAAQGIPTHKFSSSTNAPKSTPEPGTSSQDNRKVD